MFDPKLYREACRELTAPEDKIEEIIAMTEKTNKKKLRPLRTVLICAAAVAMMVVGVSAANPEAAQEIWGYVMDVVNIGQYRSEVTAADGEIWTLMQLPEAVLENRNGRAILVVEDVDIADITDALAKDGRYVHEETDEGTHLVITVTGSIDNWELMTAIGAPDSEDTDYASVISSNDPSIKEFFDGDGPLFTATVGDLGAGDGDDNVAGYIVKDGDSSALEGDVTVGFYTSEYTYP